MIIIKKIEIKIQKNQIYIFIENQKKFQFKNKFNQQIKKEYELQILRIIYSKLKIIIIF